MKNFYKAVRFETNTDAVVKESVDNLYQRILTIVSKQLTDPEIRYNLNNLLLEL